MKQLTVFLFTLHFFTATAAVKDTIPANIKNYSKEQFLKEFGKDETSEKIIGFYFKEYKKTKVKIYTFAALTFGSTAFAVYGLTPPLYFYSFASGLISAFLAIAFLYGFIEAISNRRKYSPTGLYKQLMNYQAGKPLSKKLKRQLKYFKIS